MRLIAHDHYTSSTLIGGTCRAGPSSLHTMLEGSTRMWKQDGCKVYMDSYMASNGSYLMVTKSFFQNQALDRRPYTKLGDHGTLNPHNRQYIQFYHVWGPAWIEIHWNSIWLTARSQMSSHCTWGSMVTLHDFGGVLGRALDTFLWGHSQFHGHGSWLVCELALILNSLLQAILAMLFSVGL